MYINNHPFNNQPVVFLLILITSQVITKVGNLTALRQQWTSSTQSFPKELFNQDFDGGNV
jgi:hypothetical protein